MKNQIQLKGLLFGLILLLSFSVNAQEKFIRLADNDYSHYQYMSAIANYKKGLTQLNGNDVERDRVMNRLAEMYGKTDDWKMALSYYKRLDKSGYCNKDLECRLNYAVALQYMGEDSLSLLEYNHYLDKVPGDSVALKMKNDLINLKINVYAEKYSVVNTKEINSNNDDFGLIYANRKEDEVLFTSNRKGTTGKDIDQWTSSGFSDLFKAGFSKDGKFSTPILADGNEIVNTRANEGVPFLSNNYSTLYYTRCERKPETKNENMGCVIMKAEKNGINWTKPESVLSNPESSIGQPTLSENELIMIYSGSDPNGVVGKDLWIVKRDSKRKPFGVPVNLGHTINTPGDELFPYLQNDTLLYFASNGHGGYGGLDIYKIILSSSGNYSSPENIGAPVNSNADDFAIVFNKKTDEGYFSSNRVGGKGGDDIYYFRRNELKFELSGHVIDISTRLPIEESDVLLINKQDTVIVKTNLEGYFELGNSMVKSGFDYNIFVSHQGYFTQKQNFSSNNIDNDKHWIFDFELVPIPESPIVLPQILYELDKWELLPQYQDSLRSLVNIMNDNPNIRIELISHTDASATDAYNDELSQKRAQTVVDFLVSQGVEVSRLEAKGYGKRHPRKMEYDYKSDDFLIPEGTILDEAFINTLKNTKWQEVVNQLNRRTEFSVISSTFRK